MNLMKSHGLKLAVVLNMAFCVSCDDSDDVSRGIERPATYEFSRNGESTVSYTGQTERLDMLAEMKAYIATANIGEQLDESTLLDMYANENSPFENEDLNSSTKNLESKTFITDITFFKEILISTALASGSTAAADQGKSGLVSRGAGNNILVDDKGWEYTQLVEKGLMGAVFLHQIYNVYLTDSKIGIDISNEDLVEGTNYTAMEHHWDEAFGYWGVNTAFDTEGENRFWGNYSYGRERYTGTVTKLKDAYLAGRTAIVNKDYDAMNAASELIYQEFELLAAATTIHYINDGIRDLNSADIGNLFHHISEGYGFAMALKYSPIKRITDEQLDLILNKHFGTDGDFWTITVEGLNNARSSIVSAYPSLADFAQDL